jgi:hypothetical protein
MRHTRNRAQVIHIFDTYLTRSLRSTAKGEQLQLCSSPIRRGVLMGALCLAIAILSLTSANAKTNTASDYYKLYAHSKLINSKQYECFSWIIFKESRWNPKAVNGSHYGLGQMKSQWYRNLDPYRQIDESIRYITKRYKSMCNAKAAHKVKGFY